MSQLQVNPSSQSNNATIAVGSTATVLLAANQDRNTLLMQNLDIVPVYVLLGAGATTSSFSFILPAGTAANDGTGGVFTEDTVSYTGIISAVVATGTANVQVTAF